MHELPETFRFVTCLNLNWFLVIVHSETFCCCQSFHDSALSYVAPHGVCSKQRSDSLRNICTVISITGT